MAQTIKIKRSTVLAAPSSLANGELAYSQVSQKFFIGRPGGSSTDIDAIGGKWYTDQLAVDANAKGTLVANKAVVVDSNKKINEFYVDNLSFDGNTITTTNTNGDLVLDTNGTGVIQLNSPINVGDLDAARVVLTGTGGKLIEWDSFYFSNGSDSSVDVRILGLLDVDNIRLNTNTVSTIDTNGNLVLEPNGTGWVDVNKTTGLRVARGSEATRPLAATIGDGTIRYNETSNRFEGVVNGSWTGLGGVVDIDQDTYIIAEESPDEDKLRFYTAGTERAVVDATGLTINSSHKLVTPRADIGVIVVESNSININGSTISATGNATSGTLTLDPAPAAGDAGGELIIRGNLQVTGTTTTVNSTTVQIDDPVIELGTSTAQDSLDRGALLHFNDGTAKEAFFGWDRGSEDAFTFVVDGTTADAVFKDLKLTGSITHIDGVAPAAGQLLIGNGTNGDMELATLTQGDSMTITNTDGGIELDVNPAQATATTNINNAPVSVTNAVNGVSYIIYSPGDTDFTAIGAADSNNGTVFTATGAGTGTGTIVLAAGSVYTPASASDVDYRGAATFASEQFMVSSGHVSIVELDGGYF